MKVFRIAKKTYIRDLTGIGAKRYGGRWNPKGTAILYTSEHRSLATLEMLVNNSMLTIPRDLALLTLKIPASINPHQIGLDDLPSNWRNSPAPLLLSETGAKWVASDKSVILKVPSAIIPEEQNILINPLHPDFKKISIENVSDFTLDSRFSDNI